VKKAFLQSLRTGRSFYDQLNIEVDLIKRWYGGAAKKTKKSEKSQSLSPFLSWLQFPSKN
jgi:hypothetical protein